MKITAIIIKSDNSTEEKTFNRKSEKQARNVFYDISVYASTYAVALYDNNDNLLEYKCRFEK